MRILIKECVHVGVKRALSGHLVKTVAEIGGGAAKTALCLQKRKTGWMYLSQSIAIWSVNRTSLSAKGGLSLRECPARRLGTTSRS